MKTIKLTEADRDEIARLHSKDYGVREIEEKKMANAEKPLNLTWISILC